MSDRPFRSDACNDVFQNFIPSPICRKREDFESLMCEQFGWTAARDFQVVGGLLQVARCDTIIHSGTLGLLADLRQDAFFDHLSARYPLKRDAKWATAPETESTWHWRQGYTSPAAGFSF